MNDRSSIVCVVVHVIEVKYKNVSYQTD